MDVTHKGIITLLRSGLTGEKLSLPADFSLEKACEIVRKQSVVPLVYQGAVHCGIPKNHPVMQKMLFISYQMLLAHERQMKALDGIFAGFERNGIPYLPVKGCNLKPLYPKPELRTMGDVDILIHPQDHDRIRPVMESLGFAYCVENDHVFEWDSEALHVELHKSLIPPMDEDYYSYYGSGWQLAKKGSGSRHDLSPEDAYIFIFAHFARHYRGGGIGCRHVVDLQVYRNAYPELDMDYIAGELEKLHLLEFYGNVRRMLDVWFTDREADMVSELITAFVFSGGSWGSMEAEMYSREVKNAKKAGGIRHSSLKSLLTAAFPPACQLSYRYTVIRKYPFLLPVIWVVRWIDVIFFRPQNIRKRVRILRTINDQRVLDYRQALDAVGLDFTFE